MSRKPQPRSAPLPVAVPTPSSEPAPAPSPATGHPGVQRLSGTLAVLVIVGAAFLAYGNALDGPFVYDDTDAIVENAHIRVTRLADIGQALDAPRKSSAAGRPVVGLTLGLNYLAGGLDVRGYHVVNVALHALCAVMVFGIARWCGRRRAAAAVTGPALVLALLWAVHPLTTDAIDQVIYRTEVLMSVFYLLTVYAALRAVEAAGRWRWMAAAIAASALGMGCKENMASVPLAVMALDRLVVFDSIGAALRRRWPLYAALCLTWVALLGAMYERYDGRWERVRQDAVGLHLHDLPLANYIWTQCGATAHYLRLVVWPDPLVLDYHGWPIAQGPQDVLGALALGGVVLGMFVGLLRRRPDLAWWWIVAALILAPTALTPNRGEVVGEHRMYLPMVAVLATGVAALGALLRRLIRAPAPRCAVAAMAVVGVTTALVAATRHRNEDYASELALWGDTVEKWPQGARAWNGLADAYREAGELEQAIRYYETSLERDASQLEPRLNLGGTLQMVHRHDEAIAHFERVLASNPHPQNAAKAHNNLAISMMNLQRLDEAIAQYRAAIAANPLLDRAHFNLGILLKDLGEDGEALSHFAEAARVNPGLGEAQYHLGHLYYRVGDRVAAREHLQRAVDPPNDLTYLAHDLLGQIDSQEGDHQAALGHFRAFVRLRPDMPEAHFNLGFLHMQMGNPAAAIPYFERTLELRPGFEPALRQLEAARNG